MIQKFDSFKLKKAGDVKIITLKIDGKAVVIDQEYPRSTTWESVPAPQSNARGAITRLTGRFTHRSFHADQLGGALETEPRYVLLDHDYTTTDGRPADKIILISWIPDTSPVMKKMKYAGTKEAVKSALQGIAINLNATDMAEAALSEIEAACKKI